MSSPKRIVTTADLLRTHLDLAMQFVHAYDHYGRGALEHCEWLFANDFEFYCPGDTQQVAFADLWPGTDGMQAFFDRFFGLFNACFCSGTSHPQAIRISRPVWKRLSSPALQSQLLLPSPYGPPMVCGFLARSLGLMDVDHVSSASSGSTTSG